MNIFDDLRARYREPQRHYHTGQHIGELMALSKELYELQQDPFAFGMAVWFHDAVYDPQRNDNEELSAELATRMQHKARELNPLFMSVAQVERVATMILQTKRHEWTDGHPDTALFLDLDLSILGAPAARYDEYARQVRAEYAHVSDADFRNGRRAILEAFLRRPALYFTEVGRERWELAARANTARELEAL